MSNMPIFRGRKTDSDEDEWIIGFLLKLNGEYHIHKLDTPDIIEIDPSTLAIHFPDMIAMYSDRLLPNGEKDLRVFASLNRDGKGGDILQDFNNCAYYFKVFYTNFMVTMSIIDKYLPTALDTRLKIAGIQQ